MYESYYGLTAKPFQLRPDPHFFYASKGHKRAMAYLEYGLSQEEGFIVVTGEVGAGKTTLIRSLLNKLEPSNILAGQIVNTNLGSDDVLRMVSAAFDLPYDGLPKASLLNKLEQFFHDKQRLGKRALLIVDEAQNLSVAAVEELRMLSNFHSNGRPLLQTFLLGQPEFRKILHSENMLQLRQRVTATYHLGPLDTQETQSYIEHRLRTAGWTQNPRITEAAFLAIHKASQGIPRRINSLCDRLFLMSFLEELQKIEEGHVNEVVQDLMNESESMNEEPLYKPESVTSTNTPQNLTNYKLEDIEKSLLRLEKSILSLLQVMKPYSVLKFEEALEDKNQPN